MKLFYKDYEHPSFIFNSGGYLLPILNYDETQMLERAEWKYEKSDIVDYFIKAENNIGYCDEANIITRINLNEDNYFDFNKAILDIGAHAGVYSFRTNFKHVYAFEPNKMIFSFLNINLIMHNKFDNSKTYNVLLSDKVEDLEYDGFNADKSLPVFGTTYNDISIVKAHTLDEYNLDNIGLIKIDVEGMEEKVLRGGLGTIIRNNYPPILFELWDVGNYGMTQEKHDSLQNFLEDLGYEIFWYWGDFETHLAIHK